jgi:YgiT-type zinc finger domain-containing protein
MKMTEKPVVCHVCGKKGARVVPTSRTYGKGKSLLLIQNIPMFACRICGESYFTAKTLHEIERIKSHRKALSVTRPVETVNFKRSSEKLLRAV